MITIHLLYTYYAQRTYTRVYYTAPGIVGRLLPRSDVCGATNDGGGAHVSNSRAKRNKKKPREFLPFRNTLLNGPAFPKDSLIAINPVYNMRQLGRGFFSHTPLYYTI